MLEDLMPLIIDVAEMERKYRSMERRNQVFKKKTR